MTNLAKIITALSALEDDVRALRAQVSAVRRTLEGPDPTPVTNEIRNEYQAAGPLVAQPISLPGGFVAVPEFGIGATSPAGYRVERQAAEGEITPRLQRRVLVDPAWRPPRHESHPGTQKQNPRDAGGHNAPLDPAR